MIANLHIIQHCFNRKIPMILYLINSNGDYKSVLYNNMGMEQKDYLGETFMCRYKIFDLIKKVKL